MRKRVGDKWDVFVSHNQKQKLWVREAVRQWRALGLTVFFDEDSIAPGREIVGAIEEGLQKSRHVVLIITPASLASPWVTMERALSVHDDPAADRRKLIPVALEPVAPGAIRDSIKRLRWLDLTDPGTRDVEYSRLLRSLGVRRRRLPPAPEWSQESLASSEADRSDVERAQEDVPEGADVFISYRRETGAETARLVRDELTERGFKAFLDVDDLDAQPLGEGLLREIEQAPDFVVILTPGCLDRCQDEHDWLRQEIAHAVATTRNIIPLMKDGFEFPPWGTVPEDIRDLLRRNCIRYSHEYFQATMERLTRFMTAPRDREHSPFHDGAGKKVGGRPDTDAATGVSVAVDTGRRDWRPSIDFRVNISREGDELSVTVVGTWIQGSPTMQSALDLRSAKWTEFLWRLSARETSQSFFMELGTELFHAMLPGAHLVSYEVNHQVVREAPEDRLFRLLIHTRNADLSDLPWECLRDPHRNTLLGTHPITPLSRYVEALARRPVRTVPPIRILLATAEPRSLPSVGADGEVEGMTSALSSLLQDGLVAVKLVSHATLDKLGSAIGEFQPHAFHFVGHGNKCGGTSGLLIEAAGDCGRFLEIGSLCEILRTADPLRVVVLAACTTLGAAEEIARGGIGAIGMRSKAKAEAGALFARTLYECLAHSVPLDVAANQARLSVRVELGGDQSDWCLPALFLPNGQAELLIVETPPLAARA